MITRLKEILRETALYKAINRRRKANRVRREFWAWSDDDQKRLEFYTQFMKAGDLVFDVGANRGNRAKVFCKLGANVVALEPQTGCGYFLRSVFDRTANFRLVKKALGAAVGQAEILLCDTHMISSMSPEWIQSVKDSGRFPEYEWNRKETVAVDTLDNLIIEFGRPVFVKIDVEGFEPQVIAGLSSAVRALSFEFTPEFMTGTLQCIDHLWELGQCRFQVCLGESMEYHLPAWVTAEEIKAALTKIPRDAFGDVYARFDA